MGYRTVQEEAWGQEWWMRDRDRGQAGMGSGWGQNRDGGFEWLLGRNRNGCRPRRWGWETRRKTGMGNGGQGKTQEMGTETGAEDRYGKGARGQGKDQAGSGCGRGPGRLKQRHLFPVPTTA